MLDFRLFQAMQMEKWNWGHYEIIESKRKEKEKKEKTCEQISNLHNNDGYYTKNYDEEQGHNTPISGNLMHEPK